MILFRNDFIYLSHYFFLYRKSFISSSSDLYTLLCLSVCPSEYSIWQRGRWGPIVLRITCYFDINKCIFDTILFIDLKCFSSSNAARAPCFCVFAFFKNISYYYSSCLCIPILYSPNSLSFSPSWECLSVSYPILYPFLYPWWALMIEFVCVCVKMLQASILYRAI